MKYICKYLLSLLAFIILNNSYSKQNIIQNIRKPDITNVYNHLILSFNAIQQLNIYDNFNNYSGKFNSLYNLICKCKTPIGKRLLKNRLLNPIINPEELNTRYDFIDLFNVNRMHGNDRLEQSSRIDYGISYTSTIKDSFNDLTTIQIGQSHQFDRNKYLNKNTGINEKFSDIVGNFTLKPAKAININSYFVIDKDNFSIKTAYSNLLLKQKNYYLSLSNSRYSAVIKEDGENLIDGKNQFSIKYGQKFYDFWNFTLYSTFDKKGKLKLYNYGTKIKYEDECFGMSFSWTRQYTHNPEDPTSNNFIFLFSLKEIMESDL